MKISELQKILEHYKEENGDSEVRLVISTPCKDTFYLLNSDTVIEPTNIYDVDEYNYKYLFKGLSSEEAFTELKKEGLAVTYLDIHQYIK